MLLVICGFFLFQFYFFALAFLYSQTSMFNSTSHPFFLFFVFQPTSSIVLGFDHLRLLNLEDNCIAEWDEILKLSQLRRY